MDSFFESSNSNFILVSQSFSRVEELSTAKRTYIKSEKTNKNAFGTLSLSPNSLSSSSTERCYTVHVLYLIKRKRTNFKSGKFEAKNSKNFQFRAYVSLPVC